MFVMAVTWRCYYRELTPLSLFLCSAGEKEEDKARDKDSGELEGRS